MIRLTLPHPFIRVMAICAPVFSKTVWEHAKVLIIGVVLAPGKHTVTSMFQIRDPSDHSHFQTSHRVLKRAFWSPLKASRLLLRLLAAMFLPWEVIVVGLEDPIERRCGKQSKAQGIYRDPVGRPTRIASKAVAYAGSVVWYGKGPRLRGCRGPRRQRRSRSTGW
jgi:DDE superfamily endonuclease